MVQNPDDKILTFDCQNVSEPAEDELPELVLTGFSEAENQESRLLNRRLRFRLLYYVVIAFLGGIVITYALSMLINHGQPVKMPLANSSDGTLAGEGEPVITVDVHGDVVHPGVYHLSADSRVMDAISAAGGYVHKEDSQFVNQAQQLIDGQEIMVTSSSAAPANGQTVHSNEQQSADEIRHFANTKIDLNTADESTLETIPGIGPKRASTIVEFRNTHGPFASIGDLDQVKGFGKTTLAKIQPYLYVQQNR